MGHPAFYIRNFFSQVARSHNLIPNFSCRTTSTGSCACATSTATPSRSRRWTCSPSPRPRPPGTTFRYAGVFVPFIKYLPSNFKFPEKQDDGPLLCTIIWTESTNTTCSSDTCASNIYEVCTVYLPKKSLGDEKYFFTIMRSSHLRIEF